MDTLTDDRTELCKLISELNTLQVMTLRDIANDMIKANKLDELPSFPEPYNTEPPPSETTETQEATTETSASTPKTAVKLEDWMKEDLARMDKEVDELIRGLVVH